MTNDGSSQLNRLSKAKRSLLQNRLQKSKMSQGLESVNPSLVKVLNQTQGPLSFAQQRLWYLDQIDPRNRVYNIPMAFDLLGPISVDFLKQALQNIINQQPSFRTYFQLDESTDEKLSEPKQIIAPHWSLDVQFLEAQDMPKEQCQELLQSLAMTPFSLDQLPLVKAQIIKISDSHHILFFMMHHIISDGWSMGIFQQNLAREYLQLEERKAEALSSSNLDESASDTITYLDYTLWQRDYLQNDVLDTEIKYWQQQLAGNLPSLSLPSLAMPTDYPRPKVIDYQGATVVVNCPLALTQKLENFSQQHNVTFFMVLLAGYFLLLARYTGQSDIIVGLPVAARNQPGLESLIGFFVNNLAIRLKVDKALPFSEFLQSVKSVCLEAYQHQQLPFEKLVEILNPVRDLSRTPIFQTFFSFELVKERSDQWSDEIQCISRHIDAKAARTDLGIFVEQGRDGLKCVLEYSTALFDASRMHQLLENYVHVLQEIVARAPLAMAKIALMPPAIYNQIKERTEPLARDFPLARSDLISVFKSRVRERPSAIALVDAEIRLSYQELDELSDELAKALLRRGVEANTLVGLAVPRNRYILVGILGILKAGAAYLPLDPSYPKDRLNFMVEDACVKIIVTQKQLKDSFKDMDCHRIYIDEPFVAVPLLQVKLPRLTNDYLAYTIYTSGSTGKPKGVQITHRHVLRLFAATDHWFKFDHNDCFSLFHSYAFDFSVWEIWGALLYGGTVAVVPFAVSRAPDAFYQFLVQYQVSVLSQTPSAFSQLIQAQKNTDPSQLSHLRYVVFGGETLDLASLRPWFQKYADDAPYLINMYGITETTVHVTYQRLSKALCEKNTASIIGQAILDLNLYVLDDELQFVPDGVIGELYVGGAGVANGYLSRPGLTAERFIPSPFNSRDRLYKTGDLARINVDLNLEYKGRSDQQVQLRGFRIELSEIEHTLLEHPNIDQCVVLVREDRVNDQRLVAYVVMKAYPSDDVKEYYDGGKLREYVAAFLPAYMVPQHFVILEAVPLTANGKVDKARLPEPKSVHEAGTKEVIEPSTEMEKTMVKIWQEVIGLETVSVVDDFFQVGGHSLLAVSLFNKIHQKTGINLPLAKLLEAPTIRQLSMAFGGESPYPSDDSEPRVPKGVLDVGHEVRNAWSSLVPIKASGTHPVFFCMHAVGGNVLNYAALVPHLETEQPLYGLQSQGLDGITHPYSTVTEMASAYIKEMKTIQPHGPYYLGGGSMGGMIAIEVALQLQKQGEVVALLMMFDTFGPNHGFFNPTADAASSVWMMRLKKMTQLLFDNESASIKSRLRLIFDKSKEFFKPRYQSVLFLIYRRLSKPLPHAIRYDVIESVNRTALIQYRPSEQFKGRLVLLRATDGVNAQGQAVVDEDHQDEQLGWQGFIDGDIDTLDIPGSHETFVEEDALGRCVGGYLQKMMAKAD